jgi:ribonucleoside-diphosphate reductase alpha chain
MGGDVSQLPEYFVSALEMSAADHMAMMQAVQPFIDTSISKTVNIPADYPFEDFKNLYLPPGRPASRAGHLPPQLHPGCGAGNHQAQGRPAAAPAKEAVQAVIDPMRTVIESRPKGSLSAVADKIEYWTQEGQKRLYLIVSFLPVERPEGGTVDRAIEFFMPVGQNGESQQWITSSMRLLSLAARGGFLERALEDMRKVAWDRGPVRLGTYERPTAPACPCGTTRKWRPSPTPSSRSWPSAPARRAAATGADRCAGSRDPQRARAAATRPAPS